MEENLKLVIFAHTPIMSTHLLAFIVGEFDYVEHREMPIVLLFVLIWVYTSIGKREHGWFALDLRNSIDITWLYMYRVDLLYISSPI